MENLEQKEWQEGASDTNAVIIDVRSAEECEEGIVKGAQILDIYRADEFMQAIDSMDKSKVYFLYCRSGNRSGQACMIMESKGFAQTYNLSGGMLEWDGEVVEP